MIFLFTFVSLELSRESDVGNYHWLSSALINSSVIPHEPSLSIDRVLNLVLKKFEIDDLGFKSKESIMRCIIYMF